MAQASTLSRQVANAAIQIWPNGPFSSARSSGTAARDGSLLLDGMQAAWNNTADRSYYDYIQQATDSQITTDGRPVGASSTLKPADTIALGRQLLLLYGVTQEKRYYQAATLLQARVSLDDLSGRNLSLALPFYAEYAALFQQPVASLQQPHAFADITRSLLREESPNSHALSSAAQAQDEVWGLMALVNTLPYYGENDPARKTLLAQLKHTAASAARDQRTGEQYADVSHSQNSTQGRVTECLLAYAVARAVRLGYLSTRYSAVAYHAYQDSRKYLQPDATTDAEGRASRLRSAGPGFSGAFLLASTEMVLTQQATEGRGDTVLLDAWFNSQQRKNAGGEMESFHYKWNDRSNSGFSLLGHIFRSYGISTQTLSIAPTVKDLQHAQFYIIVSPDIPSKNSHPHFMNAHDASQIAAWVKQGGVLVMMENDPANADIQHFDLLADKFGLHFNDVLSHHVVGDNIAAGTMQASGGGPLFHQPHLLYMKDTSTLTLHGPAMSLFEDKGDTMMATARYGKGTVFAVVDPWLYNEYTSGRNLPPQYDNFGAGQELVRWLIQQLPAKASH